MIVLDSFALTEANMPGGGRSGCGKIIENELCWISPATLAEAYMILKDDIGTERADLVLDVILRGAGFKVSDDRDPKLIRLVVEARSDYGVPFPVAFAAALSRVLDCPVLTNSEDYVEIENSGFCRVRHY